MNRLFSLLKKDSKTYLGRWNVDYCHKTLHTKVMFANEDHCGTCGSTTISKQVHIFKTKTDRVKELKQKTDSIRRYNEYINNAIMNRKVDKGVDIEKQIEYYICMN